MDSAVRKQNHSLFVIEIRKCSNDTLKPGEPTCASEEEIKEWTWYKSAKIRMINTKIDFNKYDDKPTRQFEIYLPNIPLR